MNIARNMEITQNDLVEDTLEIHGLETTSDFVKMMDALVETAKTRKPGKYVWLMVAKGQRKAALHLIRQYLKARGLGQGIESIIKVVEEETYEGA